LGKKGYAIVANLKFVFGALCALFSTRTT